MTSKMAQKAVSELKDEAAKQYIRTTNVFAQALCCLGEKPTASDGLHGSEYEEAMETWRAEWQAIERLKKFSDELLIGVSVLAGVEGE